MASKRTQKNVSRHFPHQKTAQTAQVNQPRRKQLKANQPAHPHRSQKKMVGSSYSSLSAKFMITMKTTEKTRKRRKKNKAKIRQSLGRRKQPDSSLEWLISLFRRSKKKSRNHAKSKKFKQILQKIKNM